MCRDKQPVKQKVKEETSSSKKCKLLAESDEDKSPAPEKEYEFKIKVINATSGKAVNRAKINIIIEKVGYPYTSNSEGLIVLTAKSANIEYEMQLALKRDSKYNLKGEMPKVKSQEKGGEPTIVKLERMMLDITKVDPHFVPTGKADAENLDIEISLSKISNLLPKPKVLLQVKSTVHAPEIVYEYLLTDQEMADGKRILKWDGKTNCISGPLNGKLISPAFGPYTLALVIKDNGFTGEKGKTNVLVHNIKLQKGEYIDDPNNKPHHVSPLPPSSSPIYHRHILYVQYRLNILGYFAGRVDGILNDQTKRAIKRYTHEMVDQLETDDPNDLAFIKSLRSSTLKTNLFENENVISNKSENSKVYIQNNYYYEHITDYDKFDGHIDRENETLDRFETPISAVIKLKSKSGIAVSSPDALHNVQVKWTVEDPDEDMSIIPDYVADLSPSSSKFYITKVLKNVKERPNNTMGDNCPESCGGVPDNADFIKTIFDDCNVQRNTRTEYISNVCSNNSKGELWGKSTVLFKGSFKGGDNFKIKASVSFDHLPLPQKSVLDTEYQKLADDDKIASTGIMTVWRKLRAVYVLDWRPSKGPAVDWTETIDSFKTAYIEFDPGAVEHILFSDLIHGNNADPFLDTINHYIPKLNIPPHLSNDFKRDKLAFQPHSLFPLDFSKRATDTETLHKERIDAIKELKTQLTHIGTGREVTGIGEWVRGIVEKIKPPGIVIVRVLTFKGETVTTTTTTTTKKHFYSKPQTISNTVTTHNYGMNEEGSSTGLGQGVVLLAENFRKILKDGFLLTHEIGHCLNLNHPHDGVDNRDNILKNSSYHHDSLDKNDMMSYLHKTGDKGGAPMRRGVVNVGPNSPYKPVFCGKCILKLRGWKVNGHDAAVSALLPNVPRKDDPCPINPSMKFIPPIKMYSGSFRDIGNTNRSLDCLKFEHVHEFKWESSSGNLESLKNQETRELIEYDKPTQALPFSYAADPDQIFAQNGGNGKDGKGTDNHSVVLPKIICQYPLFPGKITAVQKYQYRKKTILPAPKDNWKDIPEAIYIIEKEVLFENGIWVFRFCKYNGFGNPHQFKFEVKYEIGAPPAHLPRMVVNPMAVPSGAGPLPFVGATHNDPTGVIYQSGSHKAEFEIDKTPGVVDDDVLRQFGYLGHTVLP